MKCLSPIFVLIILGLIYLFSSCDNTIKYRKLKNAFENTSLNDSIPNTDSLICGLPDYSTLTAPLTRASHFHVNALFPIYPSNNNISVNLLPFCWEFIWPIWAMLAIMNKYRYA